MDTNRPSMDTNGHQWTPMATNRPSMDTNGHQRTPMDTNGHQWTPMTISIGHQWTAIDLQWTPTDHVHWTDVLEI